MRKVLALGALGLVLSVGAHAKADTFDPGTLIIPMDTTYQDSGMLKAYGLVYELLRNDIPVEWAIRPGKAYGGVDFTASATPYPSGAAVNAYGYRGGPWLIDEADAAAALPIIAAWKSKHTTTVHVATSTFDADIARRLVVAPTIAMFADGNQKVARKYMQAAAIPDSSLNYAWPDNSPDMLDPNEVAGPTTSDHSDGKLFDADGDPVYCQLMSMHWGVTDARAKPEVVAEVRSYLGHPTHFFAECQAVNAFENDTTYGHFLTPNGFLIASKPSTVDFYNADYPFAQLDGAFKTTGGSEPAYSLPAGDLYKDSDIVMLTAKGTPIGVGDVWMTGYLDGACDIGDDGEGQADACLGIGKVSYLGGHEYDTGVPISTHPESQGTRLFLNSLFEAPCATEEGQPTIVLMKSAAPSTTSATLTYTLQFMNEGPTTVLAAVLTDAIPSGSTFVSATGGGTFSNGVVTWDLQNLGDEEFDTVSFTVTLGAHGTYQNQAFLDYRVGLNGFTRSSNVTTTVYDDDTDGDGVVDSQDICPTDYNPLQNLTRDILSCGTCGTVCTAANGTPRCSAGACSISSCNSGYSDCDRAYATGCEYQNTGFPSDEANCGGCGRVCARLNSTGACLSGACTVGSCAVGYANCNGITGDGCEYDIGGFLTDRNHCGNCQTQCGNNQVCQGGTCVSSSCPAGTADCGGAVGDCETSIANDESNCGGCGIGCAPANATGVCVAGACTTGSCNAGFSDCNALAGDGCEYADSGFQSDPQNCGGCGSACAPANAVGACTGGDCTVTACDPGHSDCNLQASDGCEILDSTFATDPSNCGGCGNACAPANGTGVCASGGCGIQACDAGYVDVDADPANGCELACTPTALPETACNGDDDDCDGQTDEDFVGTTCGVGACAAVGVCMLGAEICTPAPSGAEGPMGSPSCSDAIDNDCDGAADVDDGDCNDDPVTGDAGAAGAPDPGTGGSGGTGGTTGGTASATGGTVGSADAGEAGADRGGSSSGGSSGAGGGASTAGAGGTMDGPDSGLAGEGTVEQPHGAAPQSRDAGGCGCRVAPQPASPARSLGGLLLVGLVALRRRRRSTRA